MFLHRYQSYIGTCCSYLLSYCVSWYMVTNVPANLLQPSSESQHCVFWYMGTNVPEGHTASILRDEVSKSEKVAGDTKGRGKEMGNGGITTIN